MSSSDETKNSEGLNNEVIIYEESGGQNKTLVHTPPPFLKTKLCINLNESVIHIYK